MRTREELRAYGAAGPLAEELPYWGWLDDGQTCLTRSGELMAAARIRPAVTDGRTPEEIDRALGLRQRLLSGLGPGARLYFYLLRRPSSIGGAEEPGGSDIASVSARKRQAFLANRVQHLEAYVVWSYDAGLRSVAEGSRPGLLSRLTGWRKRRRSAPTYLASEIEAATGRFRAMIDAGRSLVAEHTPVELLGAHEASGLLSELINRPGTIWDGGTGSGMNWRLALSELEAERSHLRLDGEVDDAPRRSSLPMSGPRLMAALERANDAGARCALRRSGDAHRQGSGSYRARTSCASAPRPASADRGAQAVLGATPQSGGLLRVRSQVCLRTPVPSPSGRSQPAIPPGRVLDR